MNVTSIGTSVIHVGSSFYSFLDEFVKDLPERSILVITSKVISLSEGRVRDKKGVDKEMLAQEEAEFFLPAVENKYGFTLAIKHNMIIPSSGIDESNAGNQYVLWPADPQKSANEVREYLLRRFSLSHVGVIITDSRATPLR